MSQQYIRYVIVAVIDKMIEEGGVEEELERLRETGCASIVDVTLVTDEIPLPETDGALVKFGQTKSKRSA